MKTKCFIHIKTNSIHRNDNSRISLQPHIWLVGHVKRNRKYESPKADGRRKLGECNFSVHCDYGCWMCGANASPGVTFAVLAGLLFGPVVGTICCSIATMIGAMAAFLAGTSS